MGRLFKGLVVLMTVFVLLGSFPTVAVNNSDVENYMNELSAKGVEIAVVDMPSAKTTKYMTGIDVSKYNGTIDWAKVKAAGVQFAILRMCDHVPDTPDYTVDPMFASNIAGAKAQGIHLGAYFFSYARNVNDVVNEANMVVNILKDYPATFDFPIVFDAEKGDSADGFDITSFAGDACATFRQILEQNGYFVSIYANTNWFDSVIDANKIHGADLWQAHYKDAYTGYTPNDGFSVIPDRPTIKHNNMFVYMWQYTDKGSVNGISGHVDMNICYKDYPTIIVDGGFNGFPKPEVHTHRYDTFMFDDTQHWKECRCGDKTDYGTHEVVPISYPEYHCDECATCGYVKNNIMIRHRYSGYWTSPSEHGRVCDCGYVDVSSIEKHEYDIIKYDENGHYFECICGVPDNSSASRHHFVDKYDEVGHWRECRECDYATPVEEHIMNGRDCDDCEYTKADEIQSEYDDTDADNYESEADLEADLEADSEENMPVDPSETMPEDDTTSDETDSQESDPTVLGVIVEFTVNVIKSVIYVALLPLKLVLGIFGV